MSIDTSYGIRDRVSSEIGSRLRARRHALGRTVQTVALDAGLSLPYVANLENGRGNPTLETLLRLSSALEINVRDLFDPEQPTEPADAIIADDLRAFARTKAFRTTCTRLAAAQGAPPGRFQDVLIHSLAACPRPADRPMTGTDWQRLLDAIRLILS